MPVLTNPKIVDFAQRLGRALADAEYRQWQDDLRHYELNRNDEMYDDLAMASDPVMIEKALDAIREDQRRKATSH